MLRRGFVKKQKLIFLIALISTLFGAISDSFSNEFKRLTYNFDNCPSCSLTNKERRSQKYPEKIRLIKHTNPDIWGGCYEYARENVHGCVREKHYRHCYPEGGELIFLGINYGYGFQFSGSNSWACIDQLDWEEQMEEDARKVVANLKRIAETQAENKRQAEIIKTKQLNRLALVPQKLKQLEITGNCKSCPLMNQDLSGTNLAGADLAEADLSGANLSGTNLAGAILTEANLSNANLSNANLLMAKVRNANMRGANLAGADLTGLWLDKVNLSNSNLTNATLKHVRLHNTNFNGANLEGAKFVEVMLLSSLDDKMRLIAGYSLKTFPTANFTGANLKGLDFSVKAGSLLPKLHLFSIFGNNEGKNIWESLTVGPLHTINLAGADLSQTNFSQQWLGYANLSGANMSGANFSGTHLGNANLSNATLTGTDLSNAKLDGSTKLDGADLSTANLKGIKGLDTSKLCGTKMPWGEENSGC
tara:strand:- start:1014 stop:2444 length:1431 start_codon:yes stop_codon:yes gene_type:complete